MNQPPLVRDLPSGGVELFDKGFIKSIKLAPGETTDWQWSFGVRNVLVNGFVAEGAIDDVHVTVLRIGFGKQNHKICAACAGDRNGHPLAYVLKRFDEFFTGIVHSTENIRMHLKNMSDTPREFTLSPKGYVVRDYCDEESVHAHELGHCEGPVPLCWHGLNEYTDRCSPPR